MELRSLGMDFQPDTVVENYKSLIWTERYLAAGDFELVTADIAKTRNLLPLGSMVSLKGSTDCKIVESHVIDRDPDGASKLTVTGRSFETFFENRVAHEGQYGMFQINEQAPPTYDWNLATTGEAASKYAYEIINYRSGESGDSVTYIPNVICTVASNATLASGKPRRYIKVKIGTVYERVLEILAMDDLGIRTILPGVGQTNLTINIYAGNDESTDVILSASAGHFENLSYAWSIRDYKNAAIAHSEWDWIYASGTSGSGLDRRMGWVDATDIRHNASPGANADEKELQSRAASYLRQHKELATFEGEVSSDIPYKYMKDYFLGDIVRVVADYGMNQKMRVTEYIRIEDESGEKAYPTLELP